jgi:hypothetical protein
VASEEFETVNDFHAGVFQEANNSSDDEVKERNAWKLDLILTLDLNLIPDLVSEFVLSATSTVHPNGDQVNSYSYLALNCGSANGLTTDQTISTLGCTCTKGTGLIPLFVL